MCFPPPPAGEKHLYNQNYREKAETPQRSILQNFQGRNKHFRVKSTNNAKRRRNHARPGPYSVPSSHSKCRLSARRCGGFFLPSCANRFFRSSVIENPGTMKRSGGRRNCVCPVKKSLALVHISIFQTVPKRLLIIFISKCPPCNMQQV